MANYFVYMASGLLSWVEWGVPPVRWVDVYEDGQGRGKMTAACSAAYDFNPPAKVRGL